MKRTSKGVTVVNLRVAKALARILTARLCLGLGIDLATAQENSGAPPEPDPCVANAAYDAEVSVANSYIQSQEHLRHFFADHDSPVRPMPASGFFLTFEQRLGKRRTHVLGTLSVPLREEEIKRTQGETTIYYFPKMISAGLNHPIGAMRISQLACLDHHVAAGLSTALSYRFGKLIAPFAILRLRLNVTKNSGLNVAFGYSGVIKQGAFFFPVGFSYRF